jgi:hypothetical protein
VRSALFARMRQPTAGLRDLLHVGRAVVERRTVSGEVPRASSYARLLRLAGHDADTL